MQKLLLASLFVVCSCVFCLAQNSQPTASPTPRSGNGIGNGIGIGDGGSNGKINETKTPVTSNASKVRGIRILSKTPANYTDAARRNEVEGAVRVRVTFLASGEIGSILPVTGLPFGLTEQAIEAARKIKFEPASRDGVPVSATKIVEYYFWLYYDENSSNLDSNAEILKMPEAEHPQKNDLRNLRGKVRLEVIFHPDGNLRINKVVTNLPKEFEEAARQAAAKIEFKPALHKNGKAVAQIKEIEYEFKPQND